MPELNVDIMRLLLDYFDAKTWAKLAQVCTTWRTIAYRPSVWQRLEWNPKTKYADLFYKEPPRNARHIGEPGELCWHAWFETVIVCQERNAHIPRQIVHEPNPENKLRKLRELWLQTKPCIYPQHHIWTDVVKGRAHLETLSTSEIQRLYFRILEEPTKDTNAYYNYLTNRREEYITLIVILPRDVGTAPRSPDSVVQMLRSHHQADKQALLDVETEGRDRIFVKYTTSCASLLRLGAREFTENENLYKRQWWQMLARVAFASA